MSCSGIFFGSSQRFILLNNFSIQRLSYFFYFIETLYEELVTEKEAGKIQSRLDILNYISTIINVPISKVPTVTYIGIFV